MLFYDERTHILVQFEKIHGGGELGDRLGAPENSGGPAGNVDTPHVHALIDIRLNSKDGPMPYDVISFCCAG